MILVKIHHLLTANTLLKSASRLAVQLGKEFGVLSANSEVELKQVLNNCNITECQIFINKESQNLTEFCEEKEISFLFLQLSNNDSKTIRRMLTDCRELRIPYLFFKDSFKELDLTKVILPVGFLEEELEKAQFASAFGRFCNSEIKMLLANDYGSKAGSNADKMKDLFDKFTFSYTLEKATKDSFKVETEAIQVAESEGAGIIIVSASREYGLDDLIFGPKEFHLLKKSPVPVLLVNPRGDLYALCD